MRQVGRGIKRQVGRGVKRQKGKGGQIFGGKVIVLKNYKEGNSHLI